MPVPQRLTLTSLQATFDELNPVARILLDGGLVACPTQTFYALMALVDTPSALERLTRLKGQEERRHKPFLILLDQPGRILCYAREVPEEAEGLMAGFWPGPMTLLLLAQNGLHPALVGPARTVGVRIEGLELVRRLVRMLDRGLTGTSANPPGLPPATTADQVAAYFGDQLDLIIDAGPTPGGQPSTVIDVSLGAPRILRDGGLPLNELIQACPILRFKSD